MLNRLNLFDGVFNFSVLQSISVGYNCWICLPVGFSVENFMKLYCFCVIVLRCHPWRVSFVFVIFFIFFIWTVNIQNGWSRYWLSCTLKLLQVVQLFKTFYICLTFGVLKSLRYTLKLIRLTLKWLLNGTHYIAAVFPSAFSHSVCRKFSVSHSHSLFCCYQNSEKDKLFYFYLRSCLLGLCTAKFDLFQFLISVVSWYPYWYPTDWGFGYCKFFLSFLFFFITVCHQFWLLKNIVHIIAIENKIVLLKL